ncbi:MAG: N-acetylmuramoyl-L-alanine amidase, partial [Lachnospiraceae bacterium]|nr:N-acetylmuramoyl-L-alanine amidase [Lachnospiraceae bacterium]
PTTEVPATEAPIQYVVCLDAGHGGKRGATSPLDGRFESHDTLRLTLAIQRELSKYENVTIVMTRTEDVDVENKARPQMANAAGADLFVSIHRNSNVAGDKCGVEGWIDKTNPADSRAAAEKMLAAMEAVGITLNCGVKTGSWDEPDVNYTVIEYAEMPAVLLEVGYLNHARDNELFDQNVDGYGKAIADAIYEWLTEWVE